jgi:hypothetical protein
MVYIETDVLNIETLQTRYPVVGWEIYSDDFGVAWKIIRTGNVTSICRDFEDVVRSCDREDLDTLWRIIQDQFKKDELVDVDEAKNDPFLGSHLSRNFNLFDLILP